jgi:hypothetical protein
MMSFRGIWYRQWLELRWTPVLLLAMMFLFFPLSSTNALRWDVWLALPTHPFGPELTVTPLGEAIGTEVTVWARFAGRIPWLGFVAAWILAGNGVRGLFQVEFPLNASAAYTLTLPVSRRRLVLTRFLAGLGTSVLVMGLVAGIDLIISIGRGEAVPLVPVADSLALGIVTIAALLALGGALAAAMPRSYVGPPLVYLVLFLSSLVPIHYIAAAPARGQVPWGLLAGCLALTGLALAVAVQQTGAREY